MSKQLERLATEIFERATGNEYDDDDGDHLESVCTIMDWLHDEPLPKLYDKYRQLWIEEMADSWKSERHQQNG
jgi:hypothetical protein